MKKLFFIILFMGSVNMLPAQNQSVAPTEISNPENLLPVDELLLQPQYIDGIEALRRFVAMNYNYPIEAIEDGIKGTILVEFTIDKEGNIVDPIVKSGLCKPCDAEALRIVKQLQRFEPAQDKDGQPVNTRYSLPIRLLLVE